MVPPSRKNGKPAFPPRPSLSKSSMGEFNDCERKWAYHYAWSDFDYFDFPPPLSATAISIPSSWATRLSPGRSSTT
jgi:hypothetical protein